MNGNGNGNGTRDRGWAIAVFLAGIIVAGGAAWFGLGRDVMTRPEVEQLIARSIPKPEGYAEDKKAILGDIERLRGDVKDVSQDMKGIQRQMSDMNALLQLWLQRESRAQETKR